MVRVRDQCLRPGIRNRPQHARGLRDREREVEPRYRSTPGPRGFLGHDQSDSFALRARCELGIELRDPGLDPLLCRLESGEREPELLAVDRIAARAHEELELVL